VRSELDAWERRTGRHARLVGFSAHYNISFELSAEQRGTARTVEKLALLLAHILPVPVMLARRTNRRSTGVGGARAATASRSRSTSRRAPRS
jgi:hypothetical protein